MQPLREFATSEQFELFGMMIWGVPEDFKLPVHSRESLDTNNYSSLNHVEYTYFEVK